MQKLSLATALLLVGSAVAQEPSTAQDLSPRATFLRADPGDTPVGPLIVDLASLGFSAGDTLRLRTFGDFEFVAGTGLQGDRAVGVFSESMTVLATNQSNRVPDSVPSNAPAYVSAPTSQQSLPTDIPDDFLIDLQGIDIVIPQTSSGGVPLLFLGADDVFWGDNSDPDGNFFVMVEHPDSLFVCGLCSCYELVVYPIVVPWQDAKLAAEVRSYQGVQGHLATITSAPEGDILATQPSWTNAWLGGFQPLGSPEPGGGWEWVTGEPWGYTRWGPIEPNNNGGEESLEWRSPTQYPAQNGGWNDKDESGVTPGPSISITRFIVEYELAAATPGIAVTRNAPPNPIAFMAGATAPIVGLDWLPFIDHSTFVSAAWIDIMLFSVAPATSPSPYGTVLCDLAGSLVLTSPPSAPFVVSIPNDCSLVGLTYCTQGASLDGAGIAVTNALDITIGNF